MCSLLLLLTISLELIAHYDKSRPSCLSWLLSSSCTLTEAMSGKLQGSFESRFGGSEKNYFFKDSKMTVVDECKWGKLVSYFLNNAAKTAWAQDIRKCSNQACLSV